MVTRMTLKEYRAEQAERNMSADDKLKRGTGVNERLNVHAWTDEQIQAIPENLIEFAFDHIEALRKEFGSLAAFQAYRRARRTAWQGLQE